VADGCGAVSYFFQSMGIRVNSHANFFGLARSGPNLRACGPWAVGRGEHRAPCERGPVRKGWMLNRCQCTGVGHVYGLGSCTTLIYYILS
jgi:hypothetical protein